MRGALSATLPRRRVGAAGFTLLELLIAIMILSLLMTAVGSGLYIGQKIWSRNEQRTLVAQRLRVIDEILSTHIQSAAFFQRTDPETKEKSLQFCIEDNRLSFVTAVPSLTVFKEGDSVGLREVSFFVVPDDGDLGTASGLVMREADISGEEGFDEERGTLVQLDPMVTDIKFEYEPLYDPETGKMIRMDDEDWCWPDQDTLSSARTASSAPTSDPNSAAGSGSSLLNQLDANRGKFLPMTILITLTLKVPRNNDPDSYEYEELVLPQQTYTIWETRTLYFLNKP